MLMVPRTCLVFLVQFDKKMEGEPDRPIAAAKRQKMPVERVDLERDLKIMQSVLRGPVDTGGRAGGGMEYKKPTSAKNRKPKKGNPRK